MTRLSVFDLSLSETAVTGAGELPAGHGPVRPVIEQSWVFKVSRRFSSCKQPGSRRKLATEKPASVFYFSSCRLTELLKFLATSLLTPVCRNGIYVAGDRWRTT